MRRHGTSHDASPSSFYAPSPLQQQQQSPMSSQHEGDGGNKPKKSWGDRLKLGKSEKTREQPHPGDGNLLQEYRNKYGTLSSGSALSKSMKYAETWLYGSVAVRSPSNGSTPRPSLFLYHHSPPPVTVIPATQAVVMPPGTNYAVVMCSCPEFLNGTARNKKTCSAVCKKCGGSRLLWNVSRGGGTVRTAGGSVMTSGSTVRGVGGGTLRLGGGSSGQNRVRPSLLNLTPVPQSTQNPNCSPQPLKAVTPDPYDLMRRNRLGGVKNNDEPLHFGPQDTLRVRAKSTSPCRRSVRRSPSPPVTRSALDDARPENGRLAGRRDLAWERECSNWNPVVESPDNTKRKSILECDVNAYELIAKYLKHGNRSPAENGDTSTKLEQYCRSSRDDDVLDDELSDDLSDNALENSSAGISDTAGARSLEARAQDALCFRSKTDPSSRTQGTKDVKLTTLQPPNRTPCVGKQQSPSTSIPSRVNGVTLGGQRIRIFNEPQPPSSLEENSNAKSDVTTSSEFPTHNGMASGSPQNDEFDTESSRQQERLPTSSSLIPRLTSPRRPPRKTKMSSEPSSNFSSISDVVEQEDREKENESAEASNTQTAGSSLSQAKDGKPSSASEGVCVIKSILKKPSALSPGEISSSLKTFGDTVSKPDFSLSGPAVISASSGQRHSPSPEAAVSGSSDFYLPTFQEFKQQNRKKKQVQFKVADDVTVLQPVEEEHNADPRVTTTVTTTPVRDSVFSTAAVTPDLLPVAEDNVDVALSTKLPSDKSENRNRGEKLETGSVKQEIRNKDVRFVKQEEKRSDLKDEKSTSSADVKDVNTSSVCDKEKLESLVSDCVETCDTKQENNIESVESAKVRRYFGEGGVDVVNCCDVSCAETASRSAEGVDDVPSPPGDTPGVSGGVSGSTATVSAEDLLKEHPRWGDATVVTLRRSQSERLLTTDSDNPKRHEEQLHADRAAVLFNDTMRLRLRSGRPDIRQVFSDSGAPGMYTSNGSGLDTPKRSQRMLSPGRPRPKEPPPPPPPPSSALIPENKEQSLPELPPRQIFPFTKKQIEQMNQQARQFSIKSNSKHKISSSFPRVNKQLFDSEASMSSTIRPMSWSPLATSTPQYTGETVEEVTKKKEHRHSDPGPIIPKLVVHVESSLEGQIPAPQTFAESTTKTSHRQDETRQDSKNSPGSLTSRTGDRNEEKICTIVTISTPGSPLTDVHRLQIRGEDLGTDVSPGPQKRTSIHIKSDDSSEDIKRLEFITGGNSSVTSLVVQEDIFSTSPVKKDSSNKVTISVGGASDQLLSEVKSQDTGKTNLSSLCTVIDTSPCSTLNSNNIYNRSSCGSLTVLSSVQVNVIPVSPEQQVQRTLLVVDDHDNGQRCSNTVLRCWNDDSPLSSTSGSDIRVVNSSLKVGGGVEENVKNVQESNSNVILQPRSRGIDLSSTSSVADDVDILLNPVEAVKRNLVPHVCGKKDLAPEDGSVDKTSSPTVRLDKLIELQNDIDDNERETLKEGDYFMAAVASKLMYLSTNEESPLYSNVSATVSRSSEDTLPTVIEQEEEGDDNVFQTESSSSNEADERPKPFNGLDTEDCRAEDKSLTSESSGFDTAPSSIEPEKGGIVRKEEDSDSASNSHLSICLPVKDSDAPVTEKDEKEDEVELRVKSESCSEPNTEADVDNIYESIKDPIYEEIPDKPPPLPLSPPPSLDDLEEIKRSSRSIFEGASKYDILSYLVGAKERGIVPEETYYSGSANGDEVVGIIDGKPIQDEEGRGQSHQRITSLDLGDLSSRVSHLSNASDSSEDSCNLIISNIGDAPSSPSKVRKSSAEIERNDSGVGSETSKSSRSRWQHCGPASSIREDQQHLCEDCDQSVETQVTDSGVMFAPLVCRKCGKKRAERKEIIAEIVETEEKYGRDLQIIMEEFYRPMLVAGLLTPDQLAAIFLNVEELLEHNAALAEKLRDNMEIALEQGDEDLLTVNIGKLFLEASPMLHAFESYCIRQGAASLLLSNLEKEKELLRIFLRVSQMENAVLRRMNLNSFLMVPVQRVTKYPLLLARLHKVTPAHHESREHLRQSQHKIELHLEHMNSEAKDISTTKLWRRISIMNGRRSSSETDMLSIKLRKMALDILEWNHDEVRFAVEGKLLYTNPADSNWRKGRTIKLNTINALLVTNGKPTEDYRPDPSEDALMFPRKTGVREATLLLLKEKCGRYAQLREPLYLDKCIVCAESDWEDYFEVQELASKDTFIFKAEDADRTKLWYRQLQYHAQGMGAWRRRRNALANIMINGMQTRN